MKLLLLHTNQQMLCCNILIPETQDMPCVPKNWSAFAGIHMKHGRLLWPSAYLLCIPSKGKVVICECKEWLHNYQRNQKGGRGDAKDGLHHSLCLQ